VLVAGVEGEDHARGLTDDQENRENRENHENRGQNFSTSMIATLAPFSIRVRCLADVVGSVVKSRRMRVIVANLERQTGIFLAGG